MTSAPPGPRRSDTTRAAILKAAKYRFAAEGYERATIRAIAGDADIDPSMVMRYYGSKEKLFAAAAEFDLRLPDMTVIPRDAVGDILIRHLLDRWEEDDTLVVLLRAAVSHAGAVDRMQQLFATQLAPTAAAVCPDPAEAPFRAGLVATQALGLALTRYVLRLPPVAAMNRETIISWIGPTLQRYLTAPR
jgi:AcrR family transcriptional regulator